MSDTPSSPDVRPRLALVQPSEDAPQPSATERANQEPPIPDGRLLGLKAPHPTDDDRGYISSADFYRGVLVLDRIVHPHVLRAYDELLKIFAHRVSTADCEDIESGAVYASTPDDNPWLVCHDFGVYECDRMRQVWPRYVMMQLHLMGWIRCAFDVRPAVHAYEIGRDGILHAELSMMHWLKLIEGLPRSTSIRPRKKPTPFQKLNYTERARMVRRFLKEEGLCQLQ
jgi:hypothetical protein